MKRLSINFLLALSLVSGISCKNSERSSGENSSDTGVTTSDSAELSHSSRHHEWVTLSHDDREFDAFVAYPETSEKAKPVIVIHENRGLNDWARLFADKLAEKGFLVIAPDLISNTVEGKRRTTDFDNSDAARSAIYDLDKDQVTADLNAAYEYISKDPASTGKVAVVGFCWGGSQTFRYATSNPDITSAHVFYGTAPTGPELISKISAPVYGYYGGNDNRVNSTLEETEELMEAARKKFEYVIYEDAGHAFMRSGHMEDALPANRKAHNEAWERLLKLLE
ncbi:dienelactone hydrolase family protein [Christiangramia sabulilitoris]|uniref:Dienelactone hydrolase family protein n=1 Tax=Christiangramia sabulilitoris TaxID=2583991 RepID=A0A550I6V1_9FLAO|nr:dienelactone hydrolase family protein [Christiangramia sabulilitoris]TRO66699.1 dienelactone hydrolase family protein [Christiangramia sabulilitoris]